MDGQALRELIRLKIIEALGSAPPAFTRRDVRLPGVPGKAVAVIGMRRSGKTTFLWQVLTDRLRQGTPREGLLYFNFEDERLAGMGVGDLHLLVEEYYRLHPEWRDRRRALFLLDEIQNVSGWERFVRRLLDTEQVEVFVSGSSARLLSREVATSMRGRSLEAVVYPFSFREYLRHHGQEPAQAPDRLPKAARSGLDKRLRDYLVSGGFPEAQAADARDRFELLNNYVDVVLLRDVLERQAVSNPAALRWLVRHLLGSAGGAFSVHKFHGDLRSQHIPVAKDTLHAYLAQLEDAFLIRTVSLGAGSQRRRMVNPRKVYPIDPSLIPVFDRSGRANVGHALETCVLLELERRGAEVGYLRTSAGREVDFLARYFDGRQELIQVCVELDDPETRAREIGALREAAGEHPRANLQLVTLTPESAVGIPHDVQVHSAAIWLLGTES
jgi:hypothetical protein